MEYSILLALLLPFAACAPHSAAAPIAACDGQRLAREGAIRIGLVGGYADAGPDLDADLREAGLDLVILAGDTVHRGSPRAYEALHARLGALPVLPVPGRGEARGDRHLRSWQAAWSGLALRGTDLPSTWRAVDLAVGGQTWRLVLLDADRERLGRRFVDQTFWLPKVLARDDLPLVVVINQPVGSLAADWTPEVSGGARALHTLLLRHADATRLALVAASGTRSPELSLPGGPWGEGWLGIGRAAGPAGTVRRATESLALEPGFDLALSDWFEAAGRPLADGADYTPEQAPLRGWWLLEIGPESLDATLRMRGEGDATGWQAVHTAIWSREQGWSEP